MNEKIKLLDLLRHEIDKLKMTDSSLDAEMLELMYNATSKDIYKDVLWGTKINEDHDEMGAVIESLDELPPEAEAFMAAGLRAYRNMEIVRAAN
mgnify:FL=1|tara:strand:- start:440 stop:721 length:282 start_codon:yes stop_codon:yes gene_type:complete